LLLDFPSEFVNLSSAKTEILNVKIMNKNEKNLMEIS